MIATSLALAGLVGTANASGPFILVLEPGTPFLTFDRVPFDVPSAPQRIRIRNEGAPGHDLSYLSAAGFTIVGSGGGVGTGEEKFWDVACLPTLPSITGESGEFWIDVCGSSCDDEWIDRIHLSCSPGLLDTPSVTLSMPSAYAYETSQLTVPFRNPGPSSITITGLAAHSAAFSSALANGTLPVTLEPGQGIDVIASFDNSIPDGFGLIDILSGPTVANRIGLLGRTRSQIVPPAWGMNLVPQGAIYTLPIAIRNSFPSARTITAVTSDIPDYAVRGVVGTVIAPGEFAYGLLTFTATTPGSRIGVVSVAFDSGQGDTARFFASVVGATFSVTTDDAEPTDGRLDFGTRKVDSGSVEQTITITNLEAIALPISSCDGFGGPFELVGACPVSLPAAGSVQLAVRFTPTAVGDVMSSAIISVPGVGAIASTLTARVVPAQLSVSRTDLGFPDVARGRASQQSVTITNLTTHAITVPVTITGAGFSVAETRIEVAGGAAAEVLVEFRPPAAGLFTGTLEIGAADDLDHTVVSLSGLGWSPSMGVAAALDLGTVTVGTMREAMLEIQNLDQVHSFAIANLLVEGAGFTAVMPGDPVLAPGATLAIVVRFTPAIPGPAAGTLAIVLDGESAAHGIVSLTAQGAAAPDDDDRRHGGCNAGGAGGSVGGLAIAMLAVVLRRPRRMLVQRQPGPAVA